MERIAGRLWSEGLVGGDAVAPRAPNLPAVAVLTLAVLSLGAVALLLCPVLTSAQAGPFLKTASALVVVTLPPPVATDRAPGARRMVGPGEVAGVVGRLGPREGPWPPGSMARASG